MKRRKLFCTFVPVAAMLTGGCMNSTSSVTEFDASGNVIRRTETRESIIRDVMRATENKTVLAWESGWMAYVSGSAFSAEDPSPTLKLFAGKSDKGLLSIHRDHTAVLGSLPEILRAARQELRVTSDGITAESGAK